MATKAKKPAAKKTAATKTTVTRIVADDTKKTASKDVADKVAPKSKATTKTKKTTTKVVNKAAIVDGDPTRKTNVFAAIGGYFAGAWYELKQVNWPNRKATLSLTAAMLAFTGFFVVMILLLDSLFKYLFELMLG